MTTLASGFDGQVRRITTTYDDRGMVSTVTTHDNATPGSGSVVNEVKSSYDGWGNLTTFEADPDSTIGSSGIPVKSVSYTYATATTGRNTIRRTGVTLPGSTAVTYVYDSGTNGLYDSEASRVSKVSISSVNVARYRYLGFGNVVGVDYDEADVYQHRYGATTGTYPDLDRFGRVIKSRWTKDLATDMDFVSVDVSYDENSNPLTTEDQIYDAGFDVKYAIDGMDRVTDADEGTLSSGSITSRTRRQQWTLTQTGNWQNEQLDLNGDGDETDADEHDDTRTHNAVNELTARDTDSDSTDDYTLTYDAAGNLTDDGETYAYEYDAWYRLRKIKDRGTSAVLSEHQYYGNGFRAGEHYDANEDSTVDGTDPWYWFAYDERWRIVGTFVGSDSSPKERFLHHTAGGNGYGSSSYIDQVVMRERDANTSWHASSDGTLEERLYYCQNWRHDVVALVTSAGALRERVRYSSYGVPFGIPLGDCDSDGDVDAADQSILLGVWGTSSPKCDLDLSGTIDATDQSVQLGNSGATGGVGNPTRNRNRLGHTGYSADLGVGSHWHARHRIALAAFGLWSRRDPSPPAESISLYEICDSSPTTRSDPAGLNSITFRPVGADVLGSPVGPNFVNRVGQCPNIGCYAVPFVEVDESVFDVWLVAEVTVDDSVQCCKGGSWSRSETFYELWVRLKVIHFNFKGNPHNFTFPNMQGLAKSGEYSETVTSLRLINKPNDPVEVVFPEGTSESVTICGGDFPSHTNRTSKNPPPGWLTPVAQSNNTHHMAASWSNPCCCDPPADVPFFHGAICEPGPPPIQLPWH